VASFGVSVVKNRILIDLPSSYILRYVFVLGKRIPFRK
jgi:hypothetical protein